MKAIQFIQFSPEEIQELISKSVNSKLDELKEKFQPKTPEEYLTRNEVANLLRVNLSTIHNWSKKKRLNPVRFCGKVYYKRSEIEKKLNDVSK